MSKSVPKVWFRVRQQIREVSPSEAGFIFSRPKLSGRKEKSKLSRLKWQPRLNRLGTAQPPPDFMAYLHPDQLEAPLGGSNDKTAFGNRCGNRRDTHGIIGLRNACDGHAIPEKFPQRPYTG